MAHGMDLGWWVGKAWHTASGAREPMCMTSCTRHLARRNKTVVLVVGDSTMRFLYAGLLGVLRVPHRYPHHRLARSDPCAFEHIGWPRSGPCVRKWRGPCAEAGCVFAKRWHRLRLLFAWWRNKLPLRLPVARADLLLASTGVWEAINQKNVTRYRAAVAANAHRLLSSVRYDRAILFSNGVCRAAQRLFFERNFTGWPTVAMERRVLDGNAQLARVAAARGVAYFDRGPSMLTGNDTASPCMLHHPYGKASELHARFALAHLA